jgi:hypothetical protein
MRENSCVFRKYEKRLRIVWQPIRVTKLRTYLLVLHCCVGFKAGTLKLTERPGPTSNSHGGR